MMFWGLYWSVQEGARECRIVHSEPDVTQISVRANMSEELLRSPSPFRATRRDRPTKGLNVNTGLPLAA